MQDTLPHVTTGSFRAADGAELAYVAHVADAAACWDRAFVYLHGIESHAGWFAEAAMLLSATGGPVVCMDRRGSGMNRAVGAPGHVPMDADLLDDLERGIRCIRERSEAKSIYLIGLSWGGKYAMAYDAVHPDAVDGLVLITPGIKPRVGIGWCEIGSVAWHLLFAPARLHRIPIEPEMFTTNPQHLDFIRRDSLRLHAVSAATLWHSRCMDRLLARSALRSRAPVLVILAGQDRIIDNAATRRFFARCPDRDVTLLEYPDQTHAIQLDAPQRLTRDILEWVEMRESNC